MASHAFANKTRKKIPTNLCKFNYIYSPNQFAFHTHAYFLSSPQLVRTKNQHGITFQGFLLKIKHHVFTFN